MRRLDSRLLTSESAGTLAVFAFHRGASGETDVCHVWVCDHEIESEMIEERIGAVDPGRFVIWTVDEAETAKLHAVATPAKGCWLEAGEIPPGWFAAFPSGAQIIRKAVEMQPASGLRADERLIRRRDCEYDIFRSVEEAYELPVIRAGFTSIDDFITRAQSILQRRKARSGRSLELHAREIFIEENLREDMEFQHQPESDPGSVRTSCSRTRMPTGTPHSLRRGFACWQQRPPARTAGVRS